MIGVQKITNTAGAGTRTIEFEFQRFNKKNLVMYLPVNGFILASPNTNMSLYISDVVLNNYNGNQDNVIGFLNAQFRSHLYLNDAAQIDGSIIITTKSFLITKDVRSLRVDYVESAGITLTMQSIFNVNVLASLDNRFVGSRFLRDGELFIPNEADIRYS